MSNYSSKNYSWNDISIAFGGRIIEGIDEVEYTAKQEKTVLRGRGNIGHKIVRGSKEFEGKIVLWQSEVEAMIKDAPNNDILALNFDVIWNFTPNDGGSTVTDVLRSCEVKEYKKGMKQGDANMLVELPIVFLEIKHQQ